MVATHAKARITDAAQGTERASHPDRGGHADGPAVPQLLVAGAAGERATRERMPAGAGQAAVGAADRLARRPRPLLADGRVLRPPRYLALGRPQRGRRAALSLPRLEI